MKTFKSLSLAGSVFGLTLSLLCTSVHAALAEPTAPAAPAATTAVAPTAPSAPTAAAEKSAPAGSTDNGAQAAHPHTRRFHEALASCMNQHGYPMTESESINPQGLDKSGRAQMKQCRHQIVADLLASHATIDSNSDGKN